MSAKKRRRSDPEAARRRIAEARESFAAAVDLLRREEGFRGWLEAQRSFGRYSLRNVLWVLSQMPGATHVESYRRWRDELGYQVRKGERGLQIWVPTSVKVREPDAEEDAEARRVLRFRVGHVFDVSQVEPIEGEAKPLRRPECAPIEGESHAHLIERLIAYLEGRGWRVERLDAGEQGPQGLCRHSEQLVAVRDGLSGNEEFATLVHEAAHAEGIGYRDYGRVRAEAICECATYVVLSRLGLDVAAHSVPYVAGWAGEEDEVIARDAEAIDRVATALLLGAGLAEARVDARAAAV